MKTYGYIIVAIVVIFAIGYGVGRYATPPKVQEKIVEKEVEHKVEVVHTVTVVQDHADGTKTTTTTTDDNTNVQSTTDTSTRVTVTNNKDWKVDIGEGYDLTRSNRVYMFSVDRRVLGAVSVGVWGVSNGTGGVSLGYSF
jgi:hypothetical protein